MQKLKSKLIKLNNFINSISNTHFVYTLSAVFIGVFFLSVFLLDKDFGKRFIQNKKDSSKLLEVYNLDTENIVIPTEQDLNYIEPKFYTIDLKQSGIISSIYVKAGETVQFNNLTDKDITVESVQGESLKLDIPQGTNASTTFYSKGIFYYKLSDDRVGRVYIEE